MAVPSGVGTFSHEGREEHTIACELEGALLSSTSTSTNQYLFPYLMVMALEAGGPLRAMILLLVYSLVWSLEKLLGFEESSVKVMIFVSTAGLKVSDMTAVAKSTLPRFYLGELIEEGYNVLSSCGGKKHMVSLTPRVMVEPFLREHLDVDCVVGTELRTYKGYCLGLVESPGIMLGAHAYHSLARALDGDIMDVGLAGERRKDQAFMSLCRENYVVSSSNNHKLLPKHRHPKPLIFHEGRLASKPTPSTALILFLWAPFGFCLAVARIMVGVVLPYKLGLLAAAATGFRIRADIPKHLSNTNLTKNRTGTLYVCSHRTLLDPVIISSSLQRRVMTVTYSLSKVSAILSPIPNFPLTRDRNKDGKMIRGLLERGDVVVCPEGTTCREPYLLRFSPLFAEMSDEVVPVAVAVDGVSMFYGTTVRGYKWLDSFFFLMNPYPRYNLVFLDKVCTNSMVRNSFESANYVQKVIGDELGYECTNLTRKDKYRMIAGNNGKTGSK